MSTDLLRQSIGFSLGNVSNLTIVGQVRDFVLLVHPRQTGELFKSAKNGPRAPSALTGPPVQSDDLSDFFQESGIAAKARF